MLTPPVDAVDAPRAVMWPVSRIAERDGVSKQAVSKRVRELIERHDLMVERDGRGNVVSVSVAHYDHLRSRYGDPSKAQAPDRQDAPEGAAPPARLDPRAASDGYDEALRQKTWIDAETRRFALNELRGNLVRRDRVEDALRLCAEVIARPFEQLPQEADELADAYERHGLHGLRQALKALARKGRENAADALEAAMPGQPATDEPLPFAEGKLL